MFPPKGYRRKYKYHAMHFFFFPPAANRESALVPAPWLTPGTWSTQHRAGATNLGVITEDYRKLSRRQLCHPGTAEEVSEVGLRSSHSTARRTSKGVKSALQELRVAAHMLIIIRRVSALGLHKVQTA